MVGVLGLAGGGSLIYFGAITNPIFYLIMLSGIYGTGSRLLGWDEVGSYYTHVYRVYYKLDTLDTLYAHYTCYTHYTHYTHYTNYTHLTIGRWLEERGLLQHRGFQAGPAISRLYSARWCSLDSHEG